ncbi:MAG: folylpolyglutamate synthase/dihydrofolate synthase family protein [Candidatus Firestonebacteria bacterium]
MKVESAIKYLNSFTDYEKTTGYSYNAAYFNLARIKYILSKLGNPHLKIPSIHIAGTKGKGSVANLVSGILANSGLKVGLYTSPHIITFKERIKINKKMITLKEISLLINKLKPAIDNLISNTKYGLPTYFEVYTALAFLYFYIKKVDIMVLEVGLGGRLDATNVVTPLVSVITPISLDHTKELGDILLKIAKEKLGIIKRKTMVVSSPQNPLVTKLIKKVSKEKNCRYLEVGKEVSFKIEKSNIKGSIFSMFGIRGVYHNLKLKLIGEHQVLNSVVAVSVVEVIYDKFKLRMKKSLESSIKNGIKDLVLPGRIQIVSKNPWIVVDGAHNMASMKVLKDSLIKYFPYKKLILVFGMSADKDIKGVANIISKITDLAILVKSSNYRSAEPKVMAKLVRFEKFICSNSVKEGIRDARKISNKNDLICITGSFYVVYDALKRGLNVVNN